MYDNSELRSKLARVEELIHEAERLPDDTLRCQVQELVQNLMDFHGIGLARMIDEVRKLGTPGDALLDAWSRDEVAASLLLLYGLHPVDMESRVRAALEGISYELRAQGVEVELLGTEDGVVLLRMTDRAEDHASASISVRRKVAKAIYEAAPDASAIKADGDTPHPPSRINFIPMSRLKAATCSTTSEPM
jgi:hypothetical protein